MVIKMKRLQKIKIFGMMCITLIVILCVNVEIGSALNIASIKKQMIETSSAYRIDTTTITNQKEIIDEWLRITIPGQVVINKLGVPEKKGKDEYWGATGTYMQNWIYSDLGIMLEMESERQGEEKRVFSITMVHPSKLSTSQGIVIGSNAGSVWEKYYNSIDSSNTDFNTIVVGSIYDGTIFTIEEDSVIRIFIGAAAE